MRITKKDLQHQIDSMEAFQRLDLVQVKAGDEHYVQNLPDFIRVECYGRGQVPAQGEFGRSGSRRYVGMLDVFKRGVQPRGRDDN